MGFLLHNPAQSVNPDGIGSNDPLHPYSALLWLWAICSWTAVESAPIRPPSDEQLFAPSFGRCGCNMKMKDLMKRERKRGKEKEGKSCLKITSLSPPTYTVSTYTAERRTPSSVCPNPAEDKPSTSLCLINWPFNITRSFPCFRFISCPSNDHLHLHLPYGHQLFLTRHHQPLFIMGCCNKPKISAKNLFTVLFLGFHLPSKIIQQDYLLLFCFFGLFIYQTHSMLPYAKMP